MNNSSEILDSVQIVERFQAGMFQRIGNRLRERWPEITQKKTLYEIQQNGELCITLLTPPKYRDGHMRIKYGLRRNVIYAKGE